MILGIHFRINVQFVVLARVIEMFRIFREKKLQRKRMAKTVLNNNAENYHLYSNRMQICQIFAVSEAIERLLKEMDISPETTRLKSWVFEVSISSDRLMLVIYFRIA